MGEGCVVRFLRVRSRTKTRVPFNLAPKAHWPELSTEAMMALVGISRGRRLREIEVVAAPHTKFTSKGAI